MCVCSAWDSTAISASTSRENRRSLGHIGPSYPWSRNSAAMLREAQSPPGYGLTLGLRNILQSREVLLLVSGTAKASQLCRLLRPEITRLSRLVSLVASFCDPVLRRARITGNINSVVRPCLLSGLQCRSGIDTNLQDMTHTNATSPPCHLGCRGKRSESPTAQAHGSQAHGSQAQ